MSLFGLSHIFPVDSDVLLVGPTGANLILMSDVGGDAFGAPAPGGPYGSALSVFNSTDPTGTWSLHIMDNAGLDPGSLSNGWSLTVTDAAIPEPGAALLLVGGLISLAALGRRRTRPR